MFEGMLGSMRRTVTLALSHVEVAPPAEAAATEEAAQSQVTAATSVDSKVPRNAPCPCGSGRKYKHCHGKL